jgi:hypothetical protein
MDRDFVGIDYSSSHEESYRWSQSGNVVTLTDTDGNTYTATISGNTMTAIITDAEGNINTSTLTRE